MRLTVEAVGIRLSVRPSVRLVGVWMGRASRPLWSAADPNLSWAYLSRPKQRWSSRQFLFRDCFKVAGA